MSLNGTKRERLLDWIRNGDPQDVPILMGPGFDLAASYLGKEGVTWPEAVRVAEETGTHNYAFVGGSGDAVAFVDDIEVTQHNDKTEAGVDRHTTCLQTPEGTLKAVVEFPKDKGAYHREFFVKGPQDWPAFAYYIRTTSAVSAQNPAVRQRLEASLQRSLEAVGSAFPTAIHPYCPAVLLMSSHYMDQATAIWLLHDRREEYQELMDCYWPVTQLEMEVAADNGVDIYNFAINGLEWLSPDLYERYMIPQAKRICDFARAHGKLSWIHTCGKLKRLAEMQAYQRMGVSVMESLSLPPTGDVDDLAETRRQVGADIATRGGVNCEVFYSPDPDAVRQRTEHVLDSVQGYRHMIGDTNPSVPPYPWENIAALIETVRDRGRLFT